MKTPLPLLAGLLLAGFLLLASCGDHETAFDTGKPYLVTTTDGTGCAIFTTAKRNRWEGTFYADEGNAVATKYTATLKKGKSLELNYGTGKVRPVLTIEEYEPPYYEDHPDTWQYLDSAYPVRIEHDVPYATAQGYWTSYPDTEEPYLQIFLSKLLQRKPKQLELTLDMYLPCDRGEASRPLLVLVHGGAFFNGDKASLGFPEWARYFAGRGYVVASVNYRLGFHLNTPSVEQAGVRAVRDVNAAIVYILHHADKYGVDPERIFVAGTSAGGIAALNVAFMRDNDIPASARHEGGVMAVNAEIATPFSIRAVGNLWGAVADLTILKNAPTAILSVHSTDDPVVPFGKGHPFNNFFGNNLIFPLMYGSAEIISAVGNHRAKLIPYDLPGRHTLHIDKDQNRTKRLNHRFWEIGHAMRDFFSQHMLPHPVVIEQVGNTNLFTIDAADISTLFWKVEGGVVLNHRQGKVKVLLFPDAERRTITASGKYKSGLTFNNQYPLN